MMRQALVDAKVGASQVRDALAATRAQLAREQKELETAERRGRMASEIRDEETARVAERYAAKHRGRLAMLGRKLEAQTSELALAEQELAEMTEQFHAMATGGGVRGAGVPAGAPSAKSDPLAEWTVASLDADLAGLRRAAEQTAREAEAERRLEELKRRMGR
jgi:hypothetical protein